MIDMTKYRGLDSRTHRTELENAITGVCKENGYRDVKISWRSDREFGFNWKQNRPEGWIELSIPDYLMGADKKTAEDFTNAMLLHIRTGGDVIPYFGIKDYLQSEDFLRDYQPLYFKRWRYLTLEGKDRIKAAVDRLKEEGDLVIPEDTFISFKSTHGNPAVIVSGIFHAVILDPVLFMADDREFEFALRYAFTRMNDGRYIQNRYVTGYEGLEEPEYDDIVELWRENGRFGPE